MEPANGEGSEDRDYPFSFNFIVTFYQSAFLLGKIELQTQGEDNGRKFILHWALITIVRYYQLSCGY